MPEGSARSRRVLGWTGAGLVVALVAAGGLYVAQSAATGNTLDGHYRVATAKTGSVTSQVALTGTVQRVQQASVAFPVSGTVSAVDVKVGQQVTAGQRLATLDPTALDVDLVSAQATLAAAQAQLVGAQNATTSAASASATQGSAPSAAHNDTKSTGAPNVSTSFGSNSSGSSSSHGSSSPSSAAGLAALAASARSLQGQVRTLQAANAAEERACGPFLTGSSPQPGPQPGHSPTPSSSPTSTSTSVSSTGAPVTPTPTSTQSSSPTGTPTATATPTETPTVTDTVTVTVTASPTASQDPKGLAACLADIHTLSGSVTAVARSATTLQQQARKVSSGATSTPGGTSTGGKSSGGHSSSGTGSAQSTPGRTVTTSSTSAAARGGSGGSGATGGSSVAQLQGTVAQDELAVTQATAAKAQGTLTAPISGTIAAVGLSQGGTAGSADTVTIVGAGAAQITVDATLAQLPQLAQGQRAQISVPGANGFVSGYVSNVGILANSDGTYPVVILVGSAPGALVSGVAAQAYVTTKSVSGVVTVPASAVQMVAMNRGTLTVLANGKATSQVVTVGAVGGGVAQVTGLKAGTTVALADLTQALPGSSASSSGNALTGSSAFGGGARGVGSGGGGLRRLGG